MSWINPYYHLSVCVVFTILDGASLSKPWYAFMYLYMEGLWAYYIAVFCRINYMRSLVGERLVSVQIDQTSTYDIISKYVVLITATLILKTLALPWRCGLITLAPTSLWQAWTSATLGVKTKNCIHLHMVCTYSVYTFCPICARCNISTCVLAS